MKSSDKNGAAQVIVLDRADKTERWELYRVLSDPTRLCALALLEKEELNMGELSEVLNETMSAITRCITPLKQWALIAMRKQGTRVYAKALPVHDPVVLDAVDTGRRLCEPRFFRALQRVIDARDSSSQAFFESSAAEKHQTRFHGIASELPAYLFALAQLIPTRNLALDVGTGDGRLLDILGPAFRHVIGIDTSRKQLEAARSRMKLNRHAHVELMLSNLDNAALTKRIKLLGNADAIFFSRVIHHMGKPQKAFASASSLLKRDGHIIVIDYVAHNDERLRSEQADQWLGFTHDELSEMARACGFSPVAFHVLPPAYTGKGPDAHLPWFVFSAQKKGAS